MLMFTMSSKNASILRSIIDTIPYLWFISYDGEKQCIPPNSKNSCSILKKCDFYAFYFWYAFTALGINHKSFHWAWKNKPSQTRKHKFYRNQQFFKTDNCLGRNCRVPSNLIAFSYPCFVPIRSESYISTKKF